MLESAAKLLPLCRLGKATDCECSRIGAGHLASLVRLQTRGSNGLALVRREACECLLPLPLGERSSTLPGSYPPRLPPAHTSLHTRGGPGSRPRSLGPSAVLAKDGEPKGVARPLATVEQLQRTAALR